MNLNFIDYREKLGIAFDDKDKCDYFMVLIFNSLDKIYSETFCGLDFLEYSNFCNFAGIKIDRSLYGLSHSRERFQACLQVLEKHKKDMKDFLSYYICFINCLNKERAPSFDKKTFLTLLTHSLDEAHISYSLMDNDNKYFIFPRGAKELDNALVTETFEWLSKYPLTKKAWISAIKAYTDSTELTASETADNFRKALERFFQEFFNSQKNLENLKSEYGTFLTEKDIPSELKNNFEKILEGYTNYINNYAKHHDKTSKNVLEYIMYQTGNLIRFLITLKED